MHDTQIVHVSDRRRQLSGVEPRVSLLQLSESLALDEATQVASTNQLCHQIIQVTILKMNEKSELCVERRIHYIETGENFLLKLLK